MRKKTDPQTRKQNTTSSCEQSGLIANDKKRVQSARAKPALDNRSHRTFCVFRRPESRAKHGEGVSTAFHGGRSPRPRWPAAEGRDAENACYAPYPWTKPY
jgi:hypothetical protein